MQRSFTLIGMGRAGGSLHACLVDLGWHCEAVFGRDDDVTNAAKGVDLCVIATPDNAIASTAQLIEPADAVLMHLSGATGLDVLLPHPAAGLHPLVSLSNPAAGAAQLRACYFAVAGDEISETIANDLSGKHFPIADADRACYHATAAIASNHLVALMGQVERLANSLDIPFENFLPLIASSLANVAEHGPQVALTGPAARGDMATIDQHRAALAEHHPEELDAYNTLVELAIALSNQTTEELRPADIVDRQ